MTAKFNRFDNNGGTLSCTSNYSFYNAPSVSSYNLTSNIEPNSGEGVNIEKIIEEKTNETAENYYLEFMRIFLRDDFVEGEISVSELFLERIANEYPIAFSKFFHKIWKELFFTNHDTVLACRFINFVASIDYDLIGKTNADFMLIAALGHKSSQLNESALRAIEFWSQPHFKEILENIRSFTDESLNEYKRKVVIYIEVCVS
ncbi:hypothetical protein K3H35_18850 [Aeromonas veronii]|uniref:hypothetical protein n=1 Tax=Aeromonas veronii TaxID=654 RepID=UPI001F3A2B6D|nr:hypothetical protein [Aeromonas veronii]MCF5910834.1 hypothetical protein [Aeromonas veronii]